MRNRNWIVNILNFSAYHDILPKAGTRPPFPELAKSAGLSSWRAQRGGRLWAVREKPDMGSRCRHGLQVQCLQDVFLLVAKQVGES